MIIIDKITENDLIDLSVLYQELVDEKTDVIQMKKNFLSIQSNNDYFLLGAKDESHTFAGSLLGIICTNFVGNCNPFMVIENVIVKKTYRGSGIGKLLISTIGNIAKSRNCNYTMLVSAAYRIGAHKFYESFGYGLDAVRGFKKYL